MSEQEVFDQLKYRIEVDEDSTRRYYNTAGQLHRTDGPAIEWASGVKYWYQNGQRHRTDGPATEYPNGSKFWYQNDLRHRIDGPAVEWNDGTKVWFINGERLSEAEFNQEVATNAVVSHDT